jgi:predicted molibdopterin-dependent oxidoreductase YjgC
MNSVTTAEAPVCLRSGKVTETEQGFPSFSKLSQEVIALLQADRIVPTTCPYCGVGCQLDLHLKDNLIYRVNGRFDNQVNFGNLCAKGRFGYDFVHAPDRLTRPMQRDNGGTLQPVSWETALNKVAGELRRIRDQHGPDSIAVLTSAKCTNEENYLLQKLTRAVIGTNNVDHCARL